MFRLLAQNGSQSPSWQWPWQGMVAVDVVGRLRNLMQQITASRGTAKIPSMVSTKFRSIAVIILLFSTLCRAADYWPGQVLLLDAGKGITISNSGAGAAGPYAFNPVVSAGDRIRFWAWSINNPNYQIESVTAANPGIISQRNHGWANGTVLAISGFTGAWTGLNGLCTVASATLNTFSCGISTVGATGALGRPVAFVSCTDPCSITMNRNIFGGTVNNPVGGGYGFYEEVDSAGVPLSPAKLGKFTIPGVEPPMGVAGAWTMPIEVIGQDGFVVRNQFAVAAGKPTTGLQLVMRLANHTYNRMMPSPDHSRYGYDTKMSFQICQGTTLTTCTNWIDINNTTTTPMDEYRWFNYTTVSSIGAPINTVEVYVAVPANAILANSTNSIAFRQNGVDGVTSGYRVLNFNLIEGATIQTMSSITVASNVATGNCTSSCGFSTNDWLYIWAAPGVHARFWGDRKVLSGSGTQFTFTPCNAGAPNVLGIWALSCSSPNGTFTTPVSQAATYDFTAGSVLANYPQVSSPNMYVAREVIDPTTLTWADPASFPSLGAGNTTNGHTLFTSRNTLSVSNLPELGYKFISDCATCHFDDANRADNSMVAALDVKYFNFSPGSIVARSEMHGLTHQQGLDIAAYIASIAITPPAIARPWNPPMGSCPGQEARGAYAWLAGCGLDASYVSYDQDFCEYVIAGCINGSGGSYAGWTIPSGDLGWRDLPQLIPHSDWLHDYMPQIPPADAYPNTNFFTMAASGMSCLPADGVSLASCDPYAYYLRMRTALQPQTLASLTTPSGGYWQVISDPTGAVTNGWDRTFLNFQHLAFGCIGTNNACNNLGVWPPGIEAARRRGIMNYYLQKTFETGFSSVWGMCAAAYTAIKGGGTVNAYHNLCPLYGREHFNDGGEIDGTTFVTIGATSNIFACPLGRPGCNTGNTMSALYHNYDWWKFASIVDNGNGKAIGDTIDTGYMWGFENTMGNSRPGAFGPVASLIGLGQGGQSTPFSVGVNQAFIAQQIMFFSTNAFHWMFMTPTMLTALAQGFTDAQLTQISSNPRQTLAQIQSYYLAAETNQPQGPMCTHLFNRWYSPTGGNTCSDWKVSLPILKALGVSNGTLTSMVTALGAIWSGLGPVTTFSTSTGSSTNATSATPTWHDAGHSFVSGDVGGVFTLTACTGGLGNNPVSVTGLSGSDAVLSAPVGSVASISSCTYNVQPAPPAGNFATDLASTATLSRPDTNSFYMWYRGSLY
jgi:hypothetical protein